MKILKKIKSILIGVLGIIFFAFALFMTILLLNYNDYGLTQFDDTTAVIIRDEITSENFKKGDLVLVKSKKLDNLKVGEDVFAYKVDKKGVAHVELGKIGEIYPEEKAISFENGDTYSMEFVIGGSTKVYNNIGQYLSIIESKWGFLFIVLVPCFLIFVYEVYALIIEIKYGSEENSEGK